MDGNEWLASPFERHSCPCARLSRQNELSTASGDDEPGGLAEVPPGLERCQSTKPRRSAARGDAGCPPILGATAARVITLAAGRPAPCGLQAA